MQTMGAILGQIIAKLRYLFLSKQEKINLTELHVPQGMAEFDEFYQRIISAYNFPDLPSYKSAIASMVMHLESTITHVPMGFFSSSLKKFIANQVCYEVVDIINKAKKEEAKLLKQQQEADLKPEKVLEAVSN